MDLPAEILVHLFGFLPLHDVLECSLVCRSWCQASRAPSLHPKTSLVFDNADTFRQDIQCFSGDFTRLVLKDVSLGADLNKDFWIDLLESLTALTLESCDVSEKDVSSMLKLCKNLKELRIVAMDEIMISGRLLVDDQEQVELGQALEQVHLLDLSKNNHLTDAVFNRITGCLPNIHTLILNGTKIMNHRGIYKKFYPESQKEASPSVLTFRNLLTFLTNRSRMIERLSLESTSLDGFAVQDLSKVEGLELLDLNLAKCTMVSQEAVLDLARYQKRLQGLNLDHCRRVLMDYPATTISIFQELEALKRMSLTGLTIPGPALSTGLSHQRHLKELTISFLDVPSSQVAEAVLVSPSAPKLTKLVMTSFEAAPENLQRLLCQDLKALTELQLGNCQAGVTDQVVQQICTHLVNLEVLSLQNCRRVTDAGLSGIVGQDGDDAQDKGAGKIFLGSRPELEIIQDAKRKEELEAMRSLAMTTAPGLDNLKRLKHLELNATNVSDYTLANACRFGSALKHINLSLCQEITDEGLQALAKHNPSMEEVILKQTNVGDLGLMSLISKSPRLRHLDLEACKNVSFTSISTLAMCTPRLKCLDLSFCSKIRISDLETLTQKLTCLKKVSIRGLHIAECLEELQS